MQTHTRHFDPDPDPDPVPDPEPDPDPDPDPARRDRLGSIPLSGPTMTDQVVSADIQGMMHTHTKDAHIKDDAHTRDDAHTYKGCTY